MPRLNNSLPKYRTHRASGQAVVTIEGRDFYLGPHGTRTSRREYDRLVGEWQANGRQLADQSPLTVADVVVESTSDYLPYVVADMVRFQRLTGCRPGEVCILRPFDLDMTGDVWLYRPESHKTEHHDRDRIVAIGPKAQDILRPTY
jgi:integrase